MNNGYENCTLCPRKCGVNRNNGEKGFCGADNKIRVCRAALHYWEEPCISGENGSGAVFFSGCNLKCVYCQNYSISTKNVGKAVNVEELAEIFLDLMRQGANNINLVTPTHYAFEIAEAIKLARRRGLYVPIVYNTSGYESVETLKVLDGYVDIYMPDFKYMDPELAKKYSGAYDYPEVCKKAVDEMFRQTKRPEFSIDGKLMTKGMIVRHLVLPGHTDDSEKIIEYVHKNYMDYVYISIMNQYTPLDNVKSHPEINRRVTDSEYQKVVEFAQRIGVKSGFIQDGETAKESFIPEFNCN